MRNIARSVISDHYDIFAACYSFRLLFRRRAGTAFPSSDRVLAFEQSSFLVDGRAFPGDPNPPKPGLPRGAGSNIRLAYCGRGSGASVAVSSQIRRLAADMLFKRRNSDAGRGHSPGRNSQMIAR